MPLQPLAPGDPSSVGPHRLLGRLGQGGMGTVYLAVTPHDRAVAVKVLRDGPADAEGRRRFRRELEVLQRVRGPHLVEVLEGDAEAVTPWIVTRFVPGRRLDEVVADDGPLPEEALLRLGFGMARGLRALHAAGVVHRDLTPGNVLLVDGEPYIIDLGLAFVADVTALTGSGLVVGTAGYLAPEQVLGVGCGRAADVHAWGATLAFAGTGRPPYGTGRPEAVLYRVVHGEPDLDGLPEPVAPLVARALAKDPQARPAVEDVAAQLELLPAPSRDLVAVSSGPHSVSTDLRKPSRLLDGAGTLEVAGTDFFGCDTTRVVGEDPEGPTRDITVVLGAEVTHALRWEVVGDQDRDRTPEPAEPAALDTARRPGHVQRSVVGIPAVVLLAVAALVAPVVVAAGAVVLLLALQAGARTRARRLRLVERRGSRRRDGLVGVLGLPWRTVTAVLDLLIGLPLLLGAAALPAYAVLLAVGGRRGSAAAAATVTVLGVLLTLARGRFAGARAALGAAVARVAPRPGDAVVAGAVLLAAAAVLALAAPSGPHWWPAADSPSLCLLTCN